MLVPAKATETQSDVTANPVRSFEIMLMVLKQAPP